MTTEPPFPGDPPPMSDLDREREGFRLELEQMRRASSEIYDPNRIPEGMRDGIKSYVEHGLQPGSCLRAILENDLRGAFERADHGTTRAMGAIVSYLYNHVPGSCWGSPERVTRWIERHAELRAAGIAADTSGIPITRG